MGSNGTRCTFDPVLHRYAIDGEPVPSVTQVLEMGGLTDDYRGVPPHVRAFAAQRGTFIHEACALYDAAWADPAQHHLLPAWFDSLDPAIRGYVEGWRKFREREPLLSEGIESLAWRADHGGVAGTIDRYGLWDGEGTASPCVVDIKTGSKINWTVRYQLVAYAWLQYGEQFSRVRLQVVHLKADGSYECPPPIYDRDGELRADFQAALRVVHCRLRNGHKLPESLT